MAIGKCRDCGKKVSETAESCPECGASLPAYRCKILITRKRTIYGAIDKVNVAIDGNHLFKLKNGETKEVYWLPGKHTVMFWFNPLQKKKADITLKESKVAKVYVQSAFGTGPKVEVG